MQAFFDTARRKNWNSRTKLKEKTQPLGGLSLSYAKLKKRKIEFIKNSLKTQNFQRGGSFYAIYIDKYFQKQKNLEKFEIILSKF